MAKRKPKSDSVAGRAAESMKYVDGRNPFNASDEEIDSIAAGLVSGSAGIGKAMVEVSLLIPTKATPLELKLTLTQLKEAARDSEDRGEAVFIFGEEDIADEMVDFLRSRDYLVVEKTGSDDDSETAIKFLESQPNGKDKPFLYKVVNYDEAPPIMVTGNGSIKDEELSERLTELYKRFGPQYIIDNLI